jgi:hypothetical protein
MKNIREAKAVLADRRSNFGEGQILNYFLTAESAAGSLSQRRGNLIPLWKIWITRKMMDLFFTQDLSQDQLHLILLYKFSRILNCVTILSVRG